MSFDVAVIGASGQDGTLIDRLARRRGWSVRGTSRTGLGGLDRVDPADPNALIGFLRAVDPKRVFLLAGQSSVGESFRQPEATIHSHVQPLQNVLDWMRAEAQETRLVFAASGECFGPRTSRTAAREGDTFAPVNPYGVAKSLAADLLRRYRETYRLHASNAFLFNHESPARPERFVFGKVLAGLRRLRSDPDSGPIMLGSLDVVRDWGWAEDYCEAMIRMSENSVPLDLILATGRSVSLADAVHALVSAAGLDFQEVVRSDPARHGHAIDAQYADPTRARAVIDWQGSMAFPALARLLLKESP